MSTIDALIDKLCPQGIPFYALGEVAELVRGNGMPKTDFTDSGVGAIHYGQIYTFYGAWANKTISFVAPETAVKLAKVDPGDIIITNTSENLEDVGKAVAWLGNDQIVIGGHATILKHKQEPKFIAYWFQSPIFQAQKRKLSTGTKVIDISAKSLSKVLIPIPPVEVQREIVKVLDSFTMLKREFCAALEAELETRRIQYSHYRDKLLTFSDEVRWTTLPEISINRDSQRKPVTKSARKPGEVPYYGASGVVDYVSEHILDGDYLLVSEDGANLLARSTPIAFSISGKTWVNNHAHILEFPTFVQRRFVEIYLNSINLAPYISGAAQPKLNQANLNKIPIPAPPLKEQEKIVALLDKFDALVNDLCLVLDDELNARRRQYEHYRDRLLTFAEVE